jgi:hypothetical protein
VAIRRCSFGWFIKNVETVAMVESRLCQDVVDAAILFIHFVASLELTCLLTMLAGGLRVGLKATTVEIMHVLLLGPARYIRQPLQVRLLTFQHVSFLDPFRTCLRQMF